MISLILLHVCGIIYILINGYGKNGAITLYLSNLDDPTSRVNYLTVIMGGGSYFLFLIECSEISCL